MLKYIGKGFIVGIPARDLTAEEVKKHGGEKVLVDTGLYAKPKSPAKKRSAGDSDRKSED